MKKKILFVQLSGNFSGSTKSLYNIIKYLDFTKYEPIVLFARRGIALNKFNKLGCKTYYYKLGQLRNTTHSPLKFDLKNILMIAYFLIRLPFDIIIIIKLLKAENINIVHINVSTLYSVGISSYMSKVKVVWHIREIINKNLMSILQRMIINYCSSVIICTSSEVAKPFNKYKKMVLIPVGIDLNNIQLKMDADKIRCNINIGKDVIIFLIFGAISPVRTKLKGFYDFIDAASILIKHSQRNVQFWVAGNSAIEGIYSNIGNYFLKMFGKEITSEKEKLQDYAESKGIGEFMVFWGFRENIYDYVNAADIIVVPHRVPEPFGLTILEAGSLKKAVISSNMSPTNEIIQQYKTGILVNPGDVDALSNAMIDLFVDREKIIRLGHNLYNDINQKYELNITNSKMFEVYLKLVDLNT